jgi:hypothetical protein
MRPEILVALGVVAAAALAFVLYRSSRAPVAAHSSSPASVFVFVKVPESLMPIDRGAKYEDPLNAALNRESLGEVTGGGSQLSEPDAQGRRTVEWIGLDVDLIDLHRGLPVLKRELLHLGAPSGTTFEFKRDGRQVTESIQE